MKRYLIIFLLGAMQSLSGQEDYAGSPHDTARLINAQNLSFSRLSLPVNAAFLNDDIRNMGNHYLFDKWVKGWVVSANNVVLRNDDYFFNYDKVSHNLLLTKDLKEVIEINQREFKGFTLFDDQSEYTFERIFEIDNKHFFQVLVKSDRYSLYKVTMTKLRKIEGINYYGGVWVDADQYYVVYPDGRLYKKMWLRKKSILKNLIADPDKMDTYFTAHQNEPIDERFLVNLIKYLNL